jgi:hypothetical protein
MTENIPYALGFAHGHRTQPYVDSFFEATSEYFEYKQGYLNGAAEAALELEKHNGQRLVSPTTC